MTRPRGPTRFPNPPRLCSVDGCEARHKGNGYCHKHNTQFKTHGHPEAFTRPKRATGTGTISHDGYIVQFHGGKRYYEHVWLAEKALGKPLPPGAVVHHVTERKTDNLGPFKLVICPSMKYHSLIHKLMREKNITFKWGWPNGPVGDEG